MADALPPISYQISPADGPVVMIGETPVKDTGRIAEVAPPLADPHWVEVYARVLNHVAHGYKFDLILDPPAYETEFMEEWNEEDPDAPAVPGVPTLRAYGKPDFGEIAAPRYEDGTLVFYVRETYLGIPYKVTMSIEGAPIYAPMALTQE